MFATSGFLLGFLSSFCHFRLYDEANPKKYHPVLKKIRKKGAGRNPEYGRNLPEGLAARG